MEIKVWKALSPEEQEAVLTRPAQGDSARVEGIVRDIIAAIQEGGAVAVGALTTLAAVESDAAFAGELKAVAEAAHSVATPIIRNSATIGGNLCQDVRCWYYRYPDSVGGRLMCARKGGDPCYAVQGRNQYHSIMGGMRTGKNACSHECPAGTDIPAYMQKIRENDWDAAAEIIMRVNPMPMLTSRVCPWAARMQPYERPVHPGGGRRGQRQERVCRAADPGIRPAAPPLHRHHGDF